MADKMLALRYHANMDARLEELDIPKIGPDEILTKVRATGICTTDRHIWHWGAWVTHAPFIMGHETCLEIVEIGKDVPGDRAFKPLEVGDIIIPENVLGCQKCYYCNRGWQALCDSLLLPGINDEGFFCTYQKVKWHLVHKVPEGISVTDAAMVEPAGGALHAVKRGNTTIGDTVVVMGCGPIGLFMIQQAKLAGAYEVIATDVVDMKLDLAKKLGADHALNYDKIDVVDEIKNNLTDGFGADVVLEAVGQPKLIQDAILMVKKMGTVSVMGIPEDDTPINFGRENGVLLKELNVNGTLGHTFWPTSESDFEVVMKFMKKGKILAEPMITHRLGLRDWETGFNIPPDESIKVMFTEFE